MFLSQCLRASRPPNVADAERSWRPDVENLERATRTRGGRVRVADETTPHDAWAAKTWAKSVATLPWPDPSGRTISYRGDRFARLGRSDWDADSPGPSGPRSRPRGITVSGIKP